MNATAGFSMFPLQTQDLLLDFQLPGGTTEVAFFLIGVAVIVLALVIITILKNKGKFSALNEGRFAKRGRRGFSSFTLHRIAHDMGLDREKTKMLEFVLRSDNVADPMKSLDSPDLMDRHFKRAYFLIEQTSISEDELNGRLSVLFALRNIIETYTDTVTISSTRQITENTSAVIALGDASYPTKIISSRGEALIVEHPISNRGIPAAIPNGSKLTLTFFTRSNKGFSTATRVIGFMETMNRRILKLSHSSKVKKLSNRRFRRRQTAISTSFYFVNISPSGNRKEKSLIVDKRQFVGSIMDISVGGCSIRTSAPINAGHKIKIEFTQEGDFTVAALGEVLRTNRTGHNTVMHVKFLKIPRKSLNFINAMVYEYANNN